MIETGAFQYDSRLVHGNKLRSRRERVQNNSGASKKSHVGGNDTVSAAGGSEKQENVIFMKRKQINEGFHREEKSRVKVQTEFRNASSPGRCEELSGGHSFRVLNHNGKTDIFFCLNFKQTSQLNF